MPVLEELVRRERERSQAEKKEIEGAGARIEIEGSEGEWEDVKRESRALMCRRGYVMAGIRIIGVRPVEMGDAMWCR